MPTPFDGPQSLIDCLATLVAALREDVVTDLDLVGIAIPGLVDPTLGTVRHAVNLGIGADPLPLAALLDGLLGVPVAIENDARAAALAALSLVRERHPSAQDVAYLNIGTGLSLGLVIEGRAHAGPLGHAGEIGHVPLPGDDTPCRCGLHGCLEARIAGPAIATMWPTPGGHHATALLAAAATGDPDAQRLTDGLSTAIAQMIHLVVNMTGIGDVVLGGGVALAHPDLLHAVRGHLLDLTDQAPLALAGLDVQRIIAATNEQPLGTRGAVLIPQGADRAGNRSPDHPCPESHDEKQPTSGPGHVIPRRCTMKSPMMRMLALMLATAMVAAGCVNEADTTDADSATAEAVAEEPAATDDAGPSEEETDEMEEMEETEEMEEAEATEADDADDAPASADVPEGYTALAAAEAGEYEGTEVEILSQWVEAEGENFTATLADFAERTGIDITTEGITDYETVLNVRVEGGDAPDIAQVAQPGLMQEFASSGDLVNLSEWMDVDQINTDYSEAWTDLTTVDGDTHGVFFRANTKSIVWYPVAAFEEAGYEIPETWDELIGLQDQILADDGTPWCITMEHGDATGWIATDWVEDVLLRDAGPEVYDQWVNHEIPFDSPEVIAAADKVGEIWFGEGHVAGGSTAIGATFVGDAMNPSFDDPPGCWLHRQAAWIPDFWPTDPETEEALYTPGEDSAFFFLPGDDPDDQRVLGSGDMFLMFEDRPEVRAVMEYLATADAAAGWIEAGGFISPNSSIPADSYADYASAQQAEILAEASVLRFDASDSMPAEVGQGSFWSGMVEWVAADGTNTDEVFAEIEASWPT